MFKLGHCVEDTWQEHSHVPEFSIQLTSSGQKKVLATAPGSDPLVLLAIVDFLMPPFFLLYVLHTPRGEGEPGRYQSGELDRHEISDFVERFGRFLSSDSRFDLWIHSPGDNATIVWHRHNHAYGATDSTVEALRALGFHSGEPQIPVPHQHHYHSELDDEARCLLSSQRWSYSPLEPEDEQ